MRPSPLINRFSFLSIPARLGLTLVLVTAMLVATAPPASAAPLVETLSAGYVHTCGVKADGRLACWGYNYAGAVSGPNGSTDTFTQVSAGLHRTCGLKTDGRLACWGYDYAGAVSGPNGSTETFTQVSTGYFHTCGVKADGRLACWGDNYAGSVSGPNSSTETFTHVNAGYRRTCGVKADGRLACWGHNGYGSVSGPNSSTDTFTQVSTGEATTCGLKTDARLACWGYNRDGMATGPNGSTDTFAQVSVGTYTHTCGLKADGHLACWGYNYAGSVSGPNGSTDTFTQVSAGRYHTCAQKADDGTVVCWGYNEYGKASPPGDAFAPPNPNQPPALDLDADDSGDVGGTDFAATFTEDGGAVAIVDTDLSLTDEDDMDLESAAVTITNLQNGADEALAADTAGTSITASYNSGTGVLSLTGTDTVAHYQQVLRTVTYDNTSQDPNTTARGVTFVVNDGDSDSNTATSTITVNAANDPPTAADNTVSTDEDTDKTFAPADFNFADVDAGDTLSQIQITTLESAGSLYLDDNDDGVIGPGEDVTLDQVIVTADISKLKFKPDADATGSPYATFGFKVHDGTAYSPDAYMMSVNVTSVNDPPTAADSTVSTDAETDKVFTATDFNFSDVDVGDTLSQIQITTLESAGWLYLDDNDDGVIDPGEDVTLNQVIVAADISKLKFRPPADVDDSSYATFGFSVHDGTTYSPDAYVMTINIAPKFSYIYMPIILSGSVSGPDLVVESLIATSDAVVVTIKNQGGSPVTDAFWVDVYINPDPAPSRVNQVWPDLADQGLVWGVTDPIPAGGTLILTIGDYYYWPDLSSFSTLNPETLVYAQVDSISDDNPTHGAVLETHEMSGGTYNNISGPVSSTADVMGVSAPIVEQGEAPSMQGLPPRH